MPATTDVSRRTAALLPTLSTALLLSAQLLMPGGVAAATTDRPACTPTANAVVIGVLSHRGDDLTRVNWQPTADYLSAALPGWCFRVEPLEFTAVEAAVAAASVDFVLVNPGIYVALEVRQRATRIATLRSGDAARADNVFGSVIFTRADRADLETLTDLHNRHLMAVAPTSFGGFQIAWAALLEAGVDPRRELAALSFAQTHDAVVIAVLAGETDAGIVRTGILERLAASGALRLDALRVLSPRADARFASLHSTALYPEWAFASLPHTAETLVEQVAVALLQMPRAGPAARAGGYAGWTVPLDYQPVHELLRQLRQPPYDRPETFTLADALGRYWPLLTLMLMVLASLATLAARGASVNLRLSRAKAALEQRQGPILNAVAEGIYGVDRSGRATFVNQAMERMTGWHGDDLIGCDQHQAIHHSAASGEAHPRDKCPVHAMLRDDRARFVEDDTFWRRDGSSFPVEYSVTPIHDRQGGPVGGVVVFRDVTERRQATERIRQLEREQAHVARLSTLGEMASGIAHELNQPLTAISTNARACLRLIEAKRADAESCAGVLERIAGQAERAGEVIRHIRRFVRNEEPQTRPVAVAVMLETVLVLLRQEARRTGVGMTCCIGYRVERVAAQRALIEQVLLNLAHNALEALAPQPGAPDPPAIQPDAIRRDVVRPDAIRPDAPRSPGRRLHLSARADGAQVWLAVSDNGPGIAAAVRERLFEPFVTDKPQGLGLGLSISAGIVAAHGGRLTASDRPGGGTRFAFALPVAGD